MKMFVYLKKKSYLCTLFRGLPLSCVCIYGNGGGEMKSGKAETDK